MKPVKREYAFEDANVRRGKQWVLKVGLLCRPVHTTISCSFWQLDLSCCADLLPAPSRSSP